jgi:RHH-type proline utilization regulon transcriptional repressor/proline dehydrogenase/delta 1-pyrroline-5-carboxylate dehydrogenase
MCADNLSQAVELVNDTQYGLTSGLHSLDEQEQDYFIKHLEAGNLYINRTITGAIVGRQPFGGCKASSVGPGKKAGGPLYCDQLVIIENPIIESSSSLPQSIVNLLPNLSKLSKEEQAAWKQSAESYSFFSKQYQQPQELDAVLGQKNTYYLVPKSHVTIRYNGEPFLDLLRVITACLICNVPYTVSSVKPLDIPCIQEDEIHFLSRKGMLRALSKTSNGPGVINSPVHSCGKYEVLHYLREISISFDYHRYGYLGEYDITEHSTA